MILYNDGKKSYNYNPNEKPPVEDRPKTGFESDGGRLLTAKNLANRVADWRRKHPPVEYEKVEGRDGSVGLREIRGKGEYSPVNEPVGNNPETSPDSKKSEGQSGEPIRDFLKDMGFEGDPKIEYTVTVKTPYGVFGTVTLPTFGMIKKFIENNKDNKNQKIVPNKNGQLYKIDYSPEVYAWSGGLSKEDQERLEEAFEEATLGAGMKMEPKDFGVEVDEPEASEGAKKDSEKIGEVKESLGMETGVKDREATENSEVLAEKAKKAQNFEAHKKSAEATVRILKDNEQFKVKNDTKGSLGIFEITLTNMTAKAEEADIEKLRGQPVDFAKEQKEFEIEESAMDDYVRLRDAQNELSKGKTVEEVTSNLEKKLHAEYGVERIDLSKITTLKELNDLKVPVNLSAEVTEDPKLVGTIKQINGIGFHIPGVPLYALDGKRVTNVINKDIKTGPSVVVYRAKDKN